MNGEPGKFERGRIDLPPFDEFERKMVPLGLPAGEARRQYDRLKADEIWVSPEYQVNIDREPEHGFPGMRVIHLSIKRRDKAAIHDWRDLQAIKNALVGPDFEAIEIYPAESRIVDTANQYHLWVITDEASKPVAVPVGWTSRMVFDESKAGAVQRPRNDNNKED